MWRRSNEIAAVEWVVAGPTEYAVWEIGELKGKLCCVVVKGEGVEVMVLGEDLEWRREKKFRSATGEFVMRVFKEEEEDVVPLRTQGDRYVVVWDGARRAVVARDTVTGRERAIEGAGAPGYCADFLPYISSLVEVKSYVSDTYDTEWYLK